MTYNEIMTKAGRMIAPMVYYYDNGEKIEISRDNLLKTRTSFDAGLVGTVMKGIELELNILAPATSFFIDIEASYEDNTAIKSYGEYFLKEEPTYNADSRTYTYQLYDNFLQTMVEYKAIDIEFPCSVYDYFKALVKSLGFTTDLAELTNGEQILASDIYADINFTYRDVFEDIGKATATLFKIEDKLISRCDFNENEIVINDDILKNANITFNKSFGPINTIILSRSAGSDSIALSSPESLPDEEKIAYRINDCQMLNDNNRGNFIDAILQKLKGVEFYIYDTELVGYGGFEPLQKIKFETGDNTYYSYVFSNEETITTGYEETISAEEIESQEQDYSVTSDTDKALNEVYLIVDKQNKKIESIAKNVIDISKNNIGYGRVDITDASGGAINLTVTGNYEYPIVGGTHQSLPAVCGTLQSGVTMTRGYSEYTRSLFVGKAYTNRPVIYVYKDGEIYKQYEIPYIDHLYTLNGVKDELIFDQNGAKYLKKIGVDTSGEKYLLDKIVTINLGDIFIEVPEGDSYIRMDFVNLNATYLLKNQYTDAFATKVYVNTNITQTAEQVLISANQYTDDESLKLKSEIDITAGQIVLKADANGNVVKAELTADPKEGTAFNVKADNINFEGKNFDLTAENISITSDNFSVDQDGNLTCSNAQINGSVNSKSADGDGLVNINDGSIYFSNKGEVLGTIAPTQIVYSDGSEEQGFALTIGRKSKFAIGMIDLVEGVQEVTRVIEVDGDKINRGETPIIINTPSGTLFENNPNGGVKIENGFVKSWDMAGLNGEFKISDNVYITFRDGLAVEIREE